MEEGAVANVEFKSVDRGASRINQEIERAKKHVALIGIPSDAKPPVNEKGKPVGINMAELALIMEKGSPVNGIPPRPFMQKTRMRAEGRFAGLMKKFYYQLLRGKGDAVQMLKRLGAAYEGEMKGVFTKETFAPNSPITINGGWMRNKVSGKPFKVKGKKSSRPLIDTGRLRGSIMSKVVKK